MTTISLLLVAVAYLGIGLRLIISGKPFIVVSRNVFWVFAFCFSPMIFFCLEIFINSVLTKEIGVTLNYDALKVIICFIILLTFLGVSSKGYAIFGLQQDLLNNSLDQVLVNLNLPFQKDSSKWNLISTTTRLEIINSIWVGFGFASITVAPKNKNDLLKKVVFEMNNHFTHSNLQASKITSCSYIVIGIFMVLLVIYLH